MAGPNTQPQLWRAVASNTTSLTTMRRRNVAGLRIVPPDIGVSSKRTQGLSASAVRQVDRGRI